MESVYFIQDTRVGHVKIGRTAHDVQERLRHLQTGSATPLRLLGVIAGGRSVERSLHDRLATHRVHGEWFERNAAFDLLRSIPVERWLWINHGLRNEGERPTVRPGERKRKEKRRWTAEQKRAARAAS